MNRHRSTFLAHPGVEPSCPVCHGQSYVVSRDGERATAALCTCVKACPDCRDAGFVAREDGYRVRCRCTVMRERIRRFDHAGIPARHADSTLVTFERPKKLMKPFVAVSAYVNGYRRGEENRGLVLHGAVGRGKTHLMVAIIRQLVFRYGVTARFVEFSHLLADLKSSFDRGTGTSELLDPLVRVEVLAIDELGKGRNTEWEGTVLDELVSRRYNAAATILATSNYAPGAPTGQPTGDLVKASLPTLPDRVGPRVYSRLEETCDFVLLDGADYRIKKRAKRLG